MQRHAVRKFWLRSSATVQPRTHTTSRLPIRKVRAAHALYVAMADAGITPDQVDYINAHGTSTPINEKIETMAIKKAMGESAYKVHISSTKSMTGHLLGAAGAVEAIACVMAIQNGIIPPTIGYKEPDSDCDLDITPNVVEAPVNIALSNFWALAVTMQLCCSGKWRTKWTQKN